MGSALIREGDTTSHGGRVLAGTSTNIVYGKPLALEGDMVSCPKCGGIYPIVGVRNRSMTFGDRPVATEGDKTACGATLIASQGTATVELTSGAGGRSAREKAWSRSRRHRATSHTVDASNSSTTRRASPSRITRTR